jgi:hypothetical protein
MLTRNRNWIFFRPHGKGLGVRGVWTERVVVFLIEFSKMDKVQKPSDPTRNYKIARTLLKLPAGCTRCVRKILEKKF